MSVPALLRPYEPTDREGLYRICAEVDATGAGTAPRLRVPERAGDVYAVPYAQADPGLAWVVTDEDGVAGYLVATDDVETFAVWWEEVWAPSRRAAHPRMPEDDGFDDDRYLVALHSTPSADPSLRSHPAQLHMKLHPRLQGQGWGRRLIQELSAELARRGVAGVHLGVAARNTSAIAFYERVGFRVHRATSWGRTLVLDIAG